MRTISLIALLLLFAAQPAIAQVAKPQTVANEPVSGEQINKMLKEMGLKPQLLSPGVLANDNRPRRLESPCSGIALDGRADRVGMQVLVASRPGKLCRRRRG